MADADDLLRHGDLDGARAALVEIVRAKPQDAPTRMFLFQLFALTGEWQKARLQLTTLAQITSEAQMLAAAYGLAIDAEAQRTQALAGQAEVYVHGGADGWIGDLARAIGCLARGETDEGEALRAQAFDAVPDTPGQFNGQAFDWIADCDGRFGPSFEAIISGRWGLIPFDSIERVESTGPKDLRDIIWYPVQVAFTSGQSVAAMLPGRYPGTETLGSSAEKLGRETRWVDAPGGEQGIGQRLLTLSGDEDVGLFALKNLTFN